MDDPAIHRVSQGTCPASAQDSFLLQTFGKFDCNEWVRLAVSPRSQLWAVREKLSLSLSWTETFCFACEYIAVKLSEVNLNTVFNLK